MSNKCIAIKKDGNPCSYKKKNGDYCGIHSKTSSTTSEAKVSYLYLQFGVLKRSEQCVGFDLDGTIIKTKSGNQFPKDKNDWKLIDGIKGKFSELHSKDINIIIITNQNGKGFNVEEFKEKLNDIYKEINVPFEVYVAMEKDRYRKPCIGFYDDFIKKDSKLIYFVGDAAGRCDNIKGTADHSDCDYKFALNLYIPFYTPEEFLLGKDMKEKKITYPDLSINSNIEVYIPKADLIILVGFPGSGKSFYSKTYLPQYVRVNQDSLKTKDKCLQLCEKSMNERKKIVIDNTNMQKETREEYINLAKKYKYSYEVVWINTPIDICKHNMMKRYYENNEKLISSTVYNLMKGKFNKEGIDKEIQIHNKDWKYEKYYF